MLLSAAIAQTAFYGYLLSLGNLREHIPVCLAVYCILFGLYCISTQSVFKKPTNISHVGPSKSKRIFFIIVAFSLVYRIIMLFSEPSLSDDIYRYVWEGNITASGHNPYSTAPADDSLAGFRDTEIYPSINHAHLPAIYPPLCQYLFSAVYLTGTSVFGMNAGFMLFDLGIIALLLLFLQKRNGAPERCILYAWNPLVIMEFAGTGHLDSAGIFFMLGALYLLSIEKIRCATVSLAAAFLIKMMPIVMLPFLLNKKRHSVVLLFLGTVLTAYIPFLTGGLDIFQSLNIYTRTWYFNGSLYDLIQYVVGSPASARIVALLFFLCSFVYLYRKTSIADSPDVVTYALYIIMAVIVFSPVVHPWYVCWLVPFCVLVPSRAVLILSGTVFLSYYVLIEYTFSGIWHEELPVKLAVYVPFYTMLLYELNTRVMKGNMYAGR